MEKGLKPLIDYEDPIEAPWIGRELAKKYFLQVVTRRNGNQVNSSFSHHEHLTEIWPGQVVQIHPVDAEARGIEDGDDTTVVHDRGEMDGKASVTPKIMVGVVSVTTGWGMTKERENPSLLTPTKLDPISFE